MCVCVRERASYLGEGEGGDDRECTNKRLEKTRKRGFLRV
jgi:hypothetical protein